MGKQKIIITVSAAETVQGLLRGNTNGLNSKKHTYNKYILEGESKRPRFSAEI